MNVYAIQFFLLFCVVDQKAITKETIVFFACEFFRFQNQGPPNCERFVLFIGRQAFDGFEFELPGKQTVSSFDQDDSIRGISWHRPSLYLPVCKMSKHNF